MESLKLRVRRENVKTAEEAEKDLVDRLVQAEHAAKSSAIRVEELKGHLEFAAERRIQAHNDFEDAKAEEKGS